MKLTAILLLALGGLSARADYARASFAAEDQFYVIAEVLAGEPTNPPANQELDESGWNGLVEQIDPPLLDQYARNETYNRIDAIADVERSEKSKCKPQSGVASWYGGRFQGRKTTNGERFNTNALTAAHKTLPFGTRVRVTNKKNGLSVIVRINDRGPFVRGRVIDVSHAAARALHIDGVGPVQLTCI
jgi:rare lipoprotein A